MLAASVAARPSALSDDDAATEALYAASNMQRSTRLQSVFTDFKGRPNHVTVAGPSPLGAPLVQVRSEPLASALLSDLTSDPCMGYAAAVTALQARYEAACSATVQHACGHASRASSLANLRQWPWHRTAFALFSVAKLSQRNS